MAEIKNVLYVASHEHFDPTRAGLVLRAAAAAKRNRPNAKVRVALLGAAITLMNARIAATPVTQAFAKPGTTLGYIVEWRTLQQLIDDAKGVEFFC